MDTIRTEKAQIKISKYSPLVLQPHLFKETQFIQK